MAERIAIVGSGPSAYGTLLGLLELKKQGRDLDITIYASGSADQESQIQATYKDRLDASEINSLLKQQQGEGGLLPARHFNKVPVESHQGYEGLKTDIKLSDSFGGIGNYWSSSVFPNQQIHDPVVAKLGDLSVYYDLVSGHIPVSGRKGDPLCRFFSDETINQPAIHIDPGLENLLGDQGSVVMGINRFALETEDGGDSCIACGDCMYGCQRDAIFRAGRAIWQLACEGICEIIYEKVLHFSADRTLRTEKETASFDKVYVAGGALGTMELVHNSLGAPTHALELYDTMLWYFPAFSLGLRKMGRVQDGIAFAELAGGLYDEQTPDYNHLLISRFPHAIMDKMLGRSGFSLFVSNVINRFSVIAAVYGSHDEYLTYRLEDRGAGLCAISREKSVETLAHHKFKAFQSYLSSKGWLSHQKLVMENATSSHYAGNVGLAYGVESLPETGQLMDGVYICDSAAWDGPSQSQQHSFTLMANGVRLAVASLTT
ncbi:MAG: 4Fe-4S dicluster domain-containing protein [Methylocystaceae bacterium]|nr:4Fe-4S dicluster domain-containing protein [Methylocystaceae bacterium]